MFTMISGGYSIARRFFGRLLGPADLTPAEAETIGRGFFVKG